MMMTGPTTTMTTTTGGSTTTPNGSTTTAAATIPQSTTAYVNESFHENRQSFQSLLMKFENKDSFSKYAAMSKKNKGKLLKVQNSLREKTSSHSNGSSQKSSNKSVVKSAKSAEYLSSFVSSVSTNLDFISEDEDYDDFDDADANNMMGGGAAGKDNTTITIPEDQLTTEDEDEDGEDGEENSNRMGNQTSSSNGGDGDDPMIVVEQKNNKRERRKKPRKKKREPKFATEQFETMYELGAELGAGAYAVVKEGRHKQNGQTYAIKIVELEAMDQADIDALQIEINVLSRLQHPNIVRLYETYRESAYYYLVTEKMMGGELLDRVVQKTFYNEKEARDTCLILFEAMRYCHYKKVAHRDLKPENLLLLSNDCDSNIKIADFGFAKKVPSSGLRTMCGTPGYVAPEILERVPYHTQCDMWSLGVIVYILLGGYSPFEEQSQDLLFQKIRAGDYTFHEEFWDPVSTDAKDLIRSLLTVDAKQRLTAEQALEHKWMKVSDDVLANQDLGANLTELKRFNAKRKFKAAVKTVIAAQKLTSLFGS